MIIEMLQILRNQISKNAYRIASSLRCEIERNIILYQYQKLLFFPTTIIIIYTTYLFNFHTSEVTIEKNFSRAKNNKTKISFFTICNKPRIRSTYNKIKRQIIRNFFIKFLEFLWKTFPVETEKKVDRISIINLTL